MCVDGYAERTVGIRSLNAGKLVKDAAKLIQGGGGGQPHFATAGGKNVAGLGEAVEHILDAAGLK